MPEYLSYMMANRLIKILKIFDKCECVPGFCMPRAGRRERECRAPAHERSSPSCESKKRENIIILNLYLGLGL